MPVKQLTTKYVLHPLFFIMLTFCFNNAHSQENTKLPATTETEILNLSEAELLIRAKSLRRSHQKLSTKLANKALLLATANNNNKISALAHTFLGDLAQQLKKTEQSMEHFLKAALIYKQIDDKRNYVTSSNEYIHLLFTEKRYEEGNKMAEELLITTQQYSDELPAGLVLMTQAYGYYKQKQHYDALTLYKHAIKYLSGQDKATQQALARTYHQIAQSYKHLKNNDEAIVFYKKAMGVYEALGDAMHMARTFNNLGMLERYRGNYLIALDYSIRGIEMQKKLDDFEGLAKALLGAGRIYRYLERYEKSLKHIYEAHLYYKNINDTGNIAETSNQMGLIYTRLKQFKEARSFYQLTIDLPKEKVKPKTRAAALREIAVIDLNSGDYESAFKMAKKAQIIYQDKNDKKKGSLIERIIGNIYRAQKNHTQAVTSYRKSLALATEIGNKRYQIKVLNQLGQSLIAEHTDEAIILIKKALIKSTQINMKEEMVNAYRSLRLAEKSRGNIAESLSYSEKEIALSIIINNEREKDELVLTKAKLHSYKIEIELESLREKTKLDQLELAKKTNEIEIADQKSRISELELTENRYASLALASLLLICFLAVIFIYRRFAESRTRNSELRYLASRDPLTNSYNRRMLFDLMNRDFSDLDKQSEYCIIMVDIDHFKDVTDSHGHSKSDVVLLAVANILQNSIRQNDIVARFGGEEFCITLSNATQDQAIYIAEAMRKKVEARCFDDISVTCSFGVTSIQFNAKTPTELIEQADLALYTSKVRGRNLVTLWDTTLKR